MTATARSEARAVAVMPALTNQTAPAFPARATRQSRSPPAEAALEAAVPAVEAAVLLEEEQPLRLSTPAAAITLIREIKVLLFMVGFLSVRMFNFA